LEKRIQYERSFIRSQMVNKMLLKEMETRNKKPNLQPKKEKTKSEKQRNIDISDSLVDLKSDKMTIKSLNENNELEDQIIDLNKFPSARFGFCPRTERAARTKENGFVESPEKVYPLLTEADEKNDRRSLYRKLTNKLYLIVKKPRDNHSWQFPQGGNSFVDLDNLRNTAKRELQEEVGPSLNVWWVGQYPMAFFMYNLPPAEQAKYDAEATQIFFYKAIYLDGEINLNKNELVDYQWVTRRELREYLDPTFYEYVVLKMLPSFPYD